VVLTHEGASSRLGSHLWLFLVPTGSRGRFISPRFTPLVVLCTHSLLLPQQERCCKNWSSRRSPAGSSPFLHALSVNNDAICLTLWSPWLTQFLHALSVAPVGPDFDFCFFLVSCYSFCVCIINVPLGTVSQVRPTLPNIEAKVCGPTKDSRCKAWPTSGPMVLHCWTRC